ncbi:hypothetical protein XNC3_1060021 [Xenorhabdus nematophila F1]|nr:hypothetical protein XNC3_1060021 [Xenorhabdus nematophila F1]
MMSRMGVQLTVLILIFAFVENSPNIIYLLS